MARCTRVGCGACSCGPCRMARILPCGSSTAAIGRAHGRRPAQHGPASGTRWRASPSITWCLPGPTSGWWPCRSQTGAGCCPWMCRVVRLRRGCPPRSPSDSCARPVHSSRPRPHGPWWSWTAAMMLANWPRPSWTLTAWSASACTAWCSVPQDRIRAVGARGYTAPLLLARAADARYARSVGDDAAPRLWTGGGGGCLG